MSGADENGARGTANFQSRRIDRVGPGLRSRTGLPVLLCLIYVLPVPIVGDAWSPQREDAWQVDVRNMIVLHAGDQAQVIDSGEAATVQQEPLSPAEVRRILGWREGRLIFDGQTLAQAVVEFNRYNTRQMTIADTTIANRKIAGSFRAKDLKAFLSFLQVRHGIKATCDHSTGRIELYSRN